MQDTVSPCARHKQQCVAAGMPGRSDCTKKGLKGLGRLNERVEETTRMHAACTEGGQEAMFRLRWATRVAHFSRTVDTVVTAKPLARCFRNRRRAEPPHFFRRNKRSGGGHLFVRVPAERVCCLSGLSKGPPPLCAGMPRLTRTTEMRPVLTPTTTRKKRSRSMLKARGGSAV
ncbi:hypothetical protein HPB51_022759 [Rhipicephalus microplus]|uniref:Uncharacterized protein n=1 Tax=Rhipicephalus microplus TaxID=6941 RepID=A0A9J6EIZ4_RHIMP|nr:hypothetical protein HPB51_022759 [Rhipicephalus microplus]